MNEASKTILLASYEDMTESLIRNGKITQADADYDYNKVHRVLATLDTEDTLAVADYINDLKTDRGEL
jgi:hypothetical protein